MTDGKVGDVKVAQRLDFPRGSIVAIDRGYTDYQLFTRWTREGVFFVCRLKANADVSPSSPGPCPRAAGARDEIIRLNPLRPAGRIWRICAW